MNKIKLFLDEASVAYYAGSPSISDEAFDRLAESSGYMSVGAKQHENIHKHYNRMWSLNKHYEGESTRPLKDIKDVVSTVKLDGAAISLLYIGGFLVRVLTRGDGIEGTDITSNFLAKKNLVPISIEYTGVLQVTGEVVAAKNIENARNYASGALMLKDTTEFSSRAISFYAYSVFPYQTPTFEKDMFFLESLGFSSVFTNDLLTIYDCDGIVHRVNSNELFDSMGYTAKAPKATFALKERKEAVETILLAVEWNTGRTGKVVPTAILEPVKIGDKVVTRATLNNPSFIESLELYIGCTVAIHLGGEIVPQVSHKVH